MKKILWILAILVIWPSVSWAATCPRGLEHDPEPGQCGLYTDDNKDGECDLATGANNEAKASVDSESATEKPLQVKSASDKPNHYLLEISLVLVAGYFLSLWLVDNKKISLAQNRRFWNWLLLAVFIPTAVTSLSLALAIEYGQRFDLGLDMSYWHFVFGWAFLVIASIHTWWHVRYYIKKKVVAK